MTSPTRRRWRSPTPSIGLPSSSTTMSPTRRPAAAAGPGSSSWTISRPRVRPSRAATASPQRPRPADDAEERAPDPAVDDQAVEDRARGGVDRDGQPEADPGDRGVDADDAAARVGQRPARVAGVERGVGLDDVLDEPARAPVARRQRAPERADDAGRHRAREAERVADGDDQLADAQPLGVTERRRAAGSRRSSGRRPDRTAGPARRPRSRARRRPRTWPCRDPSRRRRGPRSRDGRPARWRPPTRRRPPSSRRPGASRAGWRPTGSAARPPSRRRPSTRRGASSSEPSSGSADERPVGERGAMATVRPRRSPWCRRRPGRSARRCRGRA